MKVKQHPLSDQIAADKCLAGEDARRNPARAFARWSKAVGLPEMLRTTRQARNEKRSTRTNCFSGSHPK